MLHIATERYGWRAMSLTVTAVALVVIPIANLVRIALSGESDIWADLVAYVIPEALRVTVLLLAGVALATALVGTGAAWLVTAYRFPGRDTLSWMLALPLAFPTYIVAYVYVDFFDAFGPVQNVLHALTGWTPGSCAARPAETAAVSRTPPTRAIRRARM